ncbi:MAG TPA: hypothetical protein PLG07_07235 [Phenylobacterium sp.]|nr:hypothetical protein [Phenylobacterium sp.]
MRPYLFALSLAAALAAGAAQAQPTTVVVRARALDAKFIGTHVGGAQVTLTDARTGKTLASGKIEGAAGDTPKLMVQPAARNAPLADADTAKFTAQLDITEPTPVRAVVRAPAGMEASSTLWVLPGRNIEGDGWVLSFPGLIVEPSAVVGADRKAMVHAKVALMCGCPIEPKGLWDAANYTVSAELTRKGAEPVRFPLAYAGTKSEFAAPTPTPLAPGAYRLRIIATDATTPNAGVADTDLVVK